MSTEREGIVTIEEWRPVVGHPGYEVSNLGGTRSIDRVVKRKHWDRYSNSMLIVDYKYHGRMLRPGPKASGHLSVAIGKGNSMDVHVLVLEAFAGPCPANCESLHRDGNPANNAFTNLRWGTRSENVLEDYDRGVRRRGPREVHP